MTNAANKTHLDGLPKVIAMPLQEGSHQRQTQRRAAWGRTSFSTTRL